MTVDEYETEFDRLSKFAPRLVSDDESKARRFERGLNAHIRRGLAPLHLTSYDEMVGRAKSLDIVWRETQVDMNQNSQKKRYRDSDLQAKKSFSTPKFQATKRSQSSTTFKSMFPPR
ncbi:Retrotransposon gag protein, partial [Corchorus capsularis]